MHNKEMSLEELKIEKMRYNNNSLSYKLGLLGIVLSLIVCFISLNSLQPSSVLTIVIVLINILVFLFGFLSAEKVKAYSKKYCYFMYGLGGICIGRIFIYPLMLISNYIKFRNIINDGGTYDQAYEECNKYLGITVMGTEVKGEIVYGGYLWHNGVFRGVLLIVLLGLAAACFISSGIICYIKQKKLNNYLESLKK